MMKPLIPVGRDNSLTRTDANPLAILQQEMDRLFDGFSRSFTGLTSRALMPSMDLAETDKEIELTAELPGMEEKDVQLNVVDNHLTIRGEKKNQREEKEKDYHLVERSYGSFVRTRPAAGREHRQHQGRDVKRCPKGHGAEAGTRAGQNDRSQNGSLI